ncbi:MAG: ATP-dependent RNA helicase HrpA, partial [Acidimicrobiales bacterium]
MARRSRSSATRRVDPAELERRAERRRANVPTITYPEQLPVSQRRDEIADAIRDHQVVIVAGETGSGKTTQLPKICMELGRGVEGMIGHTQPRRLAARTVADRIAEELGVELGGAIGFAVRFTDKVGDATLVKLMTDGILLAELQRDRLLSAYDTIIVDEAHERSLNIDFILGYLAQLLPRRPDLKVIITSATIETDRFSAHFGGAPVIEVTGRTFPVELRYRPLEPIGGDGQGRSAGDVEPRDQIGAITDAVRELRREKPGDVLVFLAGERDIRDTADALRDLDLPDTEVVPLYARLSLAEQHRVFAPHKGRRIVLATNVAETSLTVPGIRYVIDVGTARISRYSPRLKVQRLPIEPVSQASADQRAGRCGRVADGICIRLYAEEDFDARPEFTEPEILRTNLASVILQMTAIGLGDIAAFPFLDPPDRRAVADGVRLLQELGALETGADDEHQRLTPVGRKLARLPIDPRFGRMVLEADRNGCLREVLIIASGLSIQDPRERPTDHAAAADQFHARFADPTSDFLAFVNLWGYVREQQRELSSSAFRRMCRREHLNFLRVREWADVHSQLRRVVADLGMTQNSEPAEPDLIHRSLLAGLLSHIGQKNRDTREYLGARQSRFAIFPGSSLARKQPDWVMAAELVETSRLWARTVARIQPEWAEGLAGHLVKRSYSEPHWSTKRAAAMAHERVTLYGLPIVADRLVGYGQVDPEHARELFVRHALVEGEWSSHHRFVADNRALLEELEELESRFRRHDLVVGLDDLERLYDERVPPDVVSGRHFDSWWKKARRAEPDLLTFTAEDLLHDSVDELDESAFPAEWTQGDLTFGLSYAFEPGSTEDGVAVHIPVAVLNQVRPVGFDWQVPGLRDELVAELIRSLPKALRRNLVPVADTARAFLDRMAADGVDPEREPLLDALERELGRIGGERIHRDDWRVDRLPPHLRLSFLVVDDDGAPVAQGDDLAALKVALVGEVRGAIAEAGSGIEQSGLTEWSFGPIEHLVEREYGGQTVKAYPALVDEGDSVAVRLLDSEAEQYASMWAGVRRLLRLTIPLSLKAVQAGLTNETRLALGWSPYPSAADLLDDCVSCALDELMAECGAGPDGGVVWDAAAFDRLRAAVRPRLQPLVAVVVGDVARVLATSREVGRRLERMTAPASAAAAADVADQRDALVYDGFVSGIGRSRLADLDRYLRAMVVRLDKQPDAPARDRDVMATVHRVQRRYYDVLDSLPAGVAPSADLIEIAWMIEELRVSLFAQTLG